MGRGAVAVGRGLWGTGTKGRGAMSVPWDGGLGACRGAPEEGAGVGVCPWGRRMGAVGAVGAVWGGGLVTADGGRLPWARGEGAAGRGGAEGQEEGWWCCGARWCVRLGGTCGAGFGCPGVMGMVGARRSARVCPTRCLWGQGLWDALGWVLWVPWVRAVGASGC